MEKINEEKSDISIAQPIVPKVEPPIVLKKVKKKSFTIIYIILFFIFFIAVFLLIAGNLIKHLVLNTNQLDSSTKVSYITAEFRA